MKKYEKKNIIENKNNVTQNNINQSVKQIISNNIPGIQDTMATAEYQCNKVYSLHWQPKQLNSKYNKNIFI